MYYYAPAEPTLDVGGFDAMILMRLAYGIDVDEHDIPGLGIQELTAVDYDYDYRTFRCFQHSI